MVSIGQNRFTVKCRYESLHLFLLKICLSQLKNVHAMNDFDLLMGTDRQTEQTRILRMVKRGSVTIGHYFLFFYYLNQHNLYMLQRMKLECSFF